MFKTERLNQPHHLRLITAAVSSDSVNVNNKQIVETLIETISLGGFAGRPPLE